MSEEELAKLIKKYSRVFKSDYRNIDWEIKKFYWYNKTKLTTGNRVSLFKQRLRPKERESVDSMKLEVKNLNRLNKEYSSYRWVEVTPKNRLNEFFTSYNKS